MTFQHYAHVLNFFFRNFSKFTTYTVFSRIETATTINFSAIQVRILIEGGSYSRVATINFSAIQVRLLIEGGSYSRVATINFSVIQVWLLIEGGSYSRVATINFIPDFRLCVITSTTNITYYITVFEPRYGKYACT